MMDKNKVLSHIADKIISVAEKENHDLEEITKRSGGANELGFFHMPELAFVYQCGKEIMLDAESVFGVNAPKWSREVNLGNGGPTDLVFEFDDGFKIAIEFKMRNTSHSYEEDILKLLRIESKNTLRVFCALIDVFTDKLPDDGRQRVIENSSLYQLKNISKKHHFKIKDNVYQKDISCVVCLWEVLDAV